MHSVFFLNFFSISILVCTVFYLLVASVIFTQIPDKSRATRILGFGYLFSGLLAIAFFPPHSLYLPWTAYHRWLSVPAALLTHTFFAQVFYNFPEPRFTRAGRILFALQLVIGAAITGLFYYVTLSREYQYSFSAHLWDFDSDDVSRIVAAGIALNILHVLIAGIVHTIARKGKRAVVGALTAAFTCTLLFPTITNVLSRDGLMERDVHQTVLVIMSIIGLFSVLIIYLNNTTDKTTFMVKVVGVSLVTFMLLMSLVSFYSFQDKEDAYDSLRAERTSRMAEEHDYPVEDLSYLLVYDLEKGKVTALRGQENISGLPMEKLSRELTNTALYEKIRTLPADNWKEGLASLLKKAPAAQSYCDFIELEARQAASPQELLGRIDSIARQIQYRQAKIREIPEKNFREDLLKYLQKMPPELAPFSAEMKRLAEAGTAPAELKSQALLVLTVFKPQGLRHYRQGENNQHFTAFAHYHAGTKSVYEAGYSYVTYRSFIHTVGLKLLFVFIGGVLLIAVGFQFFFLGTLVRPLEALLAGVRRVNSGDLDVEVRAAVQDEIGFLTVSFNSMVSSIRSAKEKLQQYADHLEEKVKERTAELSETLRVVQDLKHQQDGDYFLTSLLIKPLSRNLARSKHVEVEFLMEQKKKFEFRKWKEEIGGDLCSAHSVQLQGKDYTVFINADAMGKSMQGAGGALVLGAVFESIMERTHTMPVLRDQSPERWIKNAFQELQTVFESFDGSMLVSMVLGLIDDETGLLYYVNVEHPWTVLYRNGKAEFIEQEHMFHKLGVTGMGGQIHVHTFQLLPEDIIIAGSDGRDDLLIGTDEGGERIINEDELLFLKVVDSGQGRLSGIRSNLEELGALTDDLSLIRIAYRSAHERSADGAAQAEKISAMYEEAKRLAGAHQYSEATHLLEEALALDTKSLKTIRLLVKILLDQKNYETAFAHMEDYVYLKPMDTDMIYLASYLCKKLKRFPQAAEFGERVRLRSPAMVRNLTNLAEVYVRLGNKQRAGKLVREALRNEPGNARALRLEQALN